MYVICEIQSKNLKLFILVCNLFRHMYVYRMKLNTTYFKITQNQTTLLNDLEVKLISTFEIYSQWS